ncbi:MAG: proline dehydrogenase family protein, partial [Planctomycetota bacterium]
QKRLGAYLRALQWPSIEVVSVKISTLYSQINPLAPEHTLGVICDRLEHLYRAADAGVYRGADGSTRPKFVYLDMESYHDMHLTAEAFMRTLDRPGLEGVMAGIALQAYLPDSIGVQRQINAWARRRVAGGGRPVTIRVVKGANMQTEAVESAVAGWPMPTFTDKSDTDASFKRMVHEGMRPENLEAVRLGLASHNLFDLAYGLSLACKLHALDKVQFEMLEGMANHQRRALFELAGNMLLYAPACGHDHFTNAIGYLVRRLDENTGPDNFLRHAFRIEVDSEDWRRLEEGFVRSFDRVKGLTEAPRRLQDRRGEAPSVEMDADWRRFVNEPDTDFALPHHADWAASIVESRIDLRDDDAEQVPLVVAGRVVFGEREIAEGMDPSRPGVVIDRHRLATRGDIEQAVACARGDLDGWRAMGVSERSAVLGRVADELRASRAELMGAALADGGKPLPESDPEVSEAIDFVEFYRRCADDLYALEGVGASGRGVVAVIAPWNFPIAIPCGGVSRNTLQFLPCRGDEESELLATHDGVDTVILTGGTDTARHLLRVKPGIRLLAETGGKNATVVTAMADRDQAVGHVVRSAFGHAGQKCSATSLLILEDEVYEDERFRAALVDAASSLRVGSAWDLSNAVGPLIHEPSGPLARALTRLEPGETWALEPRPVRGLPNAWTPGVKWGVSAGSYTHLTEFFGPVLGVMRASDLDEAVALANQTGYGLTAGLESLDEREQERWRETIFAGNLYVNRSTTGAIVLRQPFGGMGKSAFGPGVKAGGPNYVAMLMRFDEVYRPLVTGEIRNSRLADYCEALRAAPDLDANMVGRVLDAAASYDHWVRREFGVEHDHFRLLGQDNLRLYHPMRRVRVRVHPRDTAFEVLARVGAALVSGCRILVSVDPSEPMSSTVRWLESWVADWEGVDCIRETDEELAKGVGAGKVVRLRYAAADRAPEAVRLAAIDSGVYVADSPVRMHGRLELPYYHEEQSVCVDYHRYGNLGARAVEDRVGPV